MVTHAEIGAAAVLVVVYLDWRNYRDLPLWRAFAAKLGRDYGLPANDEIVEEVADRLRRRSTLRRAIWFVGWAPLTFVWSCTGHVHLGLFGLGTVVTMLGSGMGTTVDLVWQRLSAQRRSKRSGAEQVAHLIRLTPAQHFTDLERRVLIGAVVVGVPMGAAALWGQGRPGLAAGWIVAGAAWSGLAWWSVLYRVNTPSRAVDDIELAWDDVLRHRSVRRAAETAVSIPAVVTPLVVLPPWFGDANVVPIYAAVAAYLTVGHVFRGGRGLWRRSWGGFGPAA